MWGYMSFSHSDKENLFHSQKESVSAASFSRFLSLYGSEEWQLKGANVPEGNTNFVFDAGSLHFCSSEYDWLVVAGEMAQFKGTGTIEGVSYLYKFKLWARDDDPDTFRIKIWEETDDLEFVVYDNGGDPLTGGNIFIHKEKKK